MTDQELIRLALDHLDATEHVLGDHGHFFSYKETVGDTAVYLVQDEDMLALGSALDASQRDAYSHWCSDTTAAECTLGRVLDLYTERDPDRVVALATEFGDVDTLAVMAHLRADFIRIAA